MILLFDLIPEPVIITLCLKRGGQLNELDIIISSYISHHPIPARRLISKYLRRARPSRTCAAFITKREAIQLSAIAGQYIVGSGAENHYTG